MLSATSVKNNVVNEKVHRIQGKQHQEKSHGNRRNTAKNNGTGNASCILLVETLEGNYPMRKRPEGNFWGWGKHPGALSQEKCLEPTVSIGPMNIVCIKLCQ